jgi:hypothetical protein
VQVEQLLPKGVDSIPQLSVALVTISKALDSEMAAMPAHEVMGCCIGCECYIWRGRVLHAVNECQIDAALSASYACLPELCSLARVQRHVTAWKPCMLSTMVDLARVRCVT